MLKIVFLVLYYLSSKGLNPVLQAWHISSHNTKHVFVFLLQKEEMKHEEIKVNIFKSASSDTHFYLVCWSCLWCCCPSRHSFAFKLCMRSLMFVYVLHVRLEFELRSSLNCIYPALDGNFRDE